MKKLGIGLTAALAMVLGLAVSASAQPTGLYFTPKVGYSHMKAGGSENGDLTYEDDGTGDNDFIAEGGASGKSGKGRAVLGLAIGYDFKPNFDVPLRAEFEYAWRGKKEFSRRWTGDINGEIDGATVNHSGDLPFATKAEFGAQSFFFNAYFDIHNDTPVTPYFGAGLGWARVTADYSISADFTETGLAGVEHLGTLSKSKNNFAWNIGAGAAWKITDNLALDLGYRYADFGKAPSVTYAESGSNIFMAGDAAELNYAFNGSRVTNHEVLLGLRVTF